MSLILCVTIKYIKLSVVIMNVVMLNVVTHCAVTQSIDSMFLNKMSVDDYQMTYCATLHNDLLYLFAALPSDLKSMQQTIDKID